jgi:hypothetical protein
MRNSCASANGRWEAPAGKERIWGRRQRRRRWPKTEVREELSFFLSTKHCPPDKPSTSRNSPKSHYYPPDGDHLPPGTPEVPLSSTGRRPSSFRKSR